MSSSLFKVFSRYCLSLSRFFSNNCLFSDKIPCCLSFASSQNNSISITPKLNSPNLFLCLKSFPGSFCPSVLFSSVVNTLSFGVHLYALSHLFQQSNSVLPLFDSTSSLNMVSSINIHTNLCFPFCFSVSRCFTLFHLPYLCLTQQFIRSVEVTHLFSSSQIQL